MTPTVTRFPVFPHSESSNWSRVIVGVSKVFESPILCAIQPEGVLPCYGFRAAIPMVITGSFSASFCGSARTPRRAFGGRSKRTCRFHPMDPHISSGNGVGHPIPGWNGIGDHEKSMACSASSMSSGLAKKARMTKKLSLSEYGFCIDNRGLSLGSCTQGTDFLALCARLFRFNFVRANCRAARSRDLPQTTYS
jgi:hypothetical protein